MSRLLPALLLLAACSSTDTKVALNTPVIDTLPGGIVRVTNPGPTAWADTNGWRFVLERVIAPSPGETGELADPRDIVVDSHGRIFVVDHDPEIGLKSFAPDGTFLQRFGRLGSGPGEFRSAVLMIANDTLVIHDPQLGRTTTYSTDGAFLRVWGTMCCHNRPLRASDAGRAPIPGTVLPDTTDTSGNPEAGISGVVWYAVDGTPRDTMLFPPQPEKPSWRIGDETNYSINTIPFQPGLSGRFAPDGTYLYGHQREYQIVVTRTGTDTLRLIRATVGTVPLPDSLRTQAVERYIRRDPRWRGVARVEDIPTTYPLWTSVTADGAGNIWVALPGPTGDSHQFDVFTPEGILWGRVSSPLTAVGRTYWSADRVYQLTENAETDLPEIRVYRIERL